MHHLCLSFNLNAWLNVARLCSEIRPVAVNAAKSSMRDTSAYGLMLPDCLPVCTWLGAIAPLVPLSPHTIYWAVEDVAFGMGNIFPLAYCATVHGVDRKLPCPILQTVLPTGGRTATPISPRGPYTVDRAIMQVARRIHAPHPKTWNTAIAHLRILSALVFVNANAIGTSTGDRALRPIFPFSPDTIDGALERVAVDGVLVRAVTVLSTMFEHHLRPFSRVHPCSTARHTPATL